MLSLDNMKVLPREVGHYVRECIFEANTGYKFKFQSALVIIRIKDNFFSRG